MMRMGWPAFTLIELLTVIAIIGILAAASVPSFRGLQARQALKSAQQSLQAMVYQVRQLNLAPSVQSSPDVPYDVVGYGLYVSHKSDTFFGCNISASNDFAGIVKFIRFHDARSTVVPVANFAKPSEATNLNSGCPTTLSVDQDSNDFYVLPSILDFQNSNLPIFVGHAIAAAGDSVNPLMDANSQRVTSGPVNLVIQDPKIKVGSPLAPINRAVSLDLTGAAQ